MKEKGRNKEKLKKHKIFTIKNFSDAVISKNDP